LTKKLDALLAKAEERVEHLRCFCSLDFSVEEVRDAIFSKGGASLLQKELSACASVLERLAAFVKESDRKIAPRRRIRNKTSRLLGG